MVVQEKRNTRLAKSTFTRNRNKQSIVGDIPMSLSQIKKKIRDTKRLLNKPGTSAKVVNESKRKLRALEFELGERTIDEFERSKATKYHKVKHFERKKTERKLKQAEQKLRETDEDENRGALEEELEDLKIKLLYVTHHPPTLDYVSLYPKSNESDPKSQKRREKLLNEIRQAVKDGDKNLVLLQKRYREQYKQELIKRGLIQPVTPVDTEEMDATTTTAASTSKAEQSTKHVVFEKEETENGDDFFEM